MTKRALKECGTSRRWIRSPSNPGIRGILREARRNRGSIRTVILEGPHLVEMAAATAGFRPERVFTLPETENRPEIRRWLDPLEKSGCVVTAVTEAVIEKLSSSRTPQGIVGVSRVEARKPEAVRYSKNGFVVVGDGIQDPGNAGTLIRTADAAGADGVILLPGSADPFSSKVLRASAGSLFHLPVVSADTETFLSWIRETGCRLVGADAAGPETVFEADLTGPIALVFGNEGSGISPVVGDGLERRVGIPVYGKAESLNVAAAAAIFLYEAARQRRLATG